MARPDRPNLYCSQRCAGLASRLSIEYIEEDRGYDTPCWIFQGSLGKNGYGSLGSKRAHRVYYERVHGPVPAGLELDHLCKQKACLNPTHLEPVTHTENVRRGPHTVLDWNKVHEIRALFLLGEHSEREISDMFGITQTAVSYIVRNTQWVDPDYTPPGKPRDRSKLAREKGIIYSRFQAGATMQTLADEYGVAISTIHRMIHRMATG